MTNVQSKLAKTVTCTCKDFQHPWTKDCANATAGLLLSAIPYCLRVYSVVYAISLLMRNRIPKRVDIKRTINGIIQSSSFLTVNAFTFILYNCVLRQLYGCYSMATVAFVPAFLASLTAIVVERPQRRPLLALYVANVTTETLWNMAEARGLVRSIPHGKTLIYGAGISVLLYLYRLGLHRSKCKDTLFNILRVFLGRAEEGPIQAPLSAQGAASATQAASAELDNNSDSDSNSSRSSSRRSSSSSSRPPVNIVTVSGLVAVYGRLIDSLKHCLETRHACCPHKQSCFRYVLMGGLKPFFTGVGLQLVLKLVMNLRKILMGRATLRKTIANSDTLKLGIFLGSFSYLYKAVSCILRHSFGFDNAIFAIPAGLISSVAFTQYPDITVALYVLWKTLQIVYNLGISEGYLPKIPGFTIMLYSLSTAVLFHAGILEPKTLRPSYYKFLQTISGGRFSNFNFELLDGFGLNTSQQANEVMQKLRITSKGTLPQFALTS